MDEKFVFNYFFILAIKNELPAFEFQANDGVLDIFYLKDDSHFVAVSESELLVLNYRETSGSK